MSFNLSSTSLHDINANEVTADNLYISSNINVSGTSNFNNIMISDNTTLSSSLNVSGI